MPTEVGKPDWCNCQSANSATQLYFYIKFLVWHQIVSRYTRQTRELWKTSDSYYNVKKC